MVTFILRLHFWYCVGKKTWLLQRRTKKKIHFYNFFQRYGTKSIEEYKGRLEFLCSRLKQVLPFDTLVIWNTTMPISSRARGGFLVPEVSYCNRTLRLDILEANYFARNVVVNHGYDVLDLHFFFRNLLEWRVEDGIHW